MKRYFVYMYAIYYGNKPDDRNPDGTWKDTPEELDNYKQYLAKLEKIDTNRISIFFIDFKDRVVPTYDKLPSSDYR